MIECLRKLKRPSVFKLLTLLIFVGSVASLDSSSTLPPNHKDPIDTVSSKDLKLEARTDDIPNEQEATQKLTSLPKVYPVYPESRSTTEKKSSEKDSYLDALNHSHLNKYSKDNTKILIQRPKITKLIRRNYESPVYRGPTVSNDLSSASPRISINQDYQTSSDAYSLPGQQATNFNEQNPYGTYGAPQYGTPEYNYEPPSQSYGYGPPKQSYGPPAQTQQGEARGSWTGYQLPSLPSVGFAWPLAIKLNAFTIAKIILKLVIFKMIVKFIAVICLLLFIPKLQSKTDEKDNDDGNDDDGRRLMSRDSTVRLNLLTARVLESIDKYGLIGGPVDNEGENCSGISCRLRRLIGTNDTWNDYVQLFNSYAAEEENNLNDNSLEAKT